MTGKLSQKEKAEHFHQLHHHGKMLVLTNIWDPLGAILMESLGYPAIATASASIAFTNGYHDGENIPFVELLTLLARITKSVDLPVTADIESGYADTDQQLRENIKLLIEAGIVGINIEDTDRKTGTLRSVESQSEIIRSIRKVSQESGIPLFINARTDVYLHSKSSATGEPRFDQLLNRAQAYREAGADGFFPILLKREDEIKELVTRIKLPLNILTLPGIPDLKTLSDLGVSRVSLGPSLLKIAVRAMKELAVALKDHEGLSVITENEITTDYLKNLVDKKY